MVVVVREKAAGGEVELIDELILGRGADGAAKEHAVQAADFLRKNTHGHPANDGADGFETIVVDISQAITRNHRPSTGGGIVRRLDAPDDNVGRALARNVIQG